MIHKLAVAVTLLLLLGAAGCGSDRIPVDSPSSPLGSGGTPSVLCGPDAGGTIMTFGPLVLDNRGNGTVTIQRVSFYGDDHLRLLRAVILPIRGSLIGVDYGWPPPRDVLADSEARWSQAVPAARAAIPPHLHVPDQRNLVIEMRPMAYRSVFAGVQVLYKEFGKQYELRTRTRTDIYIAKAVPAHC